MKKTKTSFRTFTNGTFPNIHDFPLSWCGTGTLSEKK